MKLPVGVPTLHFSAKSALPSFLAVGLIGVGAYDYVEQSRAVDDPVPARVMVTDAS
jgi:hypothetical protein